MGASAVKDAVLSVLKGTTIGRTVAAEVKAREAVRQGRVDARAKVDAGLEARKALPKLADAEAKAQAKYELETKRHAAQLAETQRLYREALYAADALFGRGESLLRRTAHPLVHDNGPVFRAVEGAIQHMGQHYIGVGDEDRIRRMAKLEPLSSAKEDCELIELAREMVNRHDEAAELADVFRFVSDELRDLQLEVDVEPATVREIVDGLPAKCIAGCIHTYEIAEALDKALAPMEVK